jgi:glutamine cyclotransferase
MAFTSWFDHGRRSALAAAAALALVGCAPADAVSASTAPTASPVETPTVRATLSAPPRRLLVEVATRLPHDRSAFTQGLLIHRGQMYESTGLEGQSQVRHVELDTGRVLASAPFDRREFGEGLTVWDGELIALTWTDGVARRWRIGDLAPAGTYRYEGQGWGLTADRTHLIQSNGSANLVFRNPDTFAIERTLTVRAAGRAVTRLNELEYIDGRIWANIWMTPWIAVIDPADGRVTDMVDLSPLVAEVGADNYDAVANGIAWDAVNRRLYVTGKLWPTLFQIHVPALGI